MPLIRLGWMMDDGLRCLRYIDIFFYEIERGVGVMGIVLDFCFFW